MNTIVVTDPNRLECTLQTDVPILAHWWIEFLRGTLNQEALLGLMARSGAPEGALQSVQALITTCLGMPV